MTTRTRRNGGTGRGTRDEAPAARRSRRGGRDARRKRIRYAVIGLGYIAQIAVLPAFKNARANSQLAALVSGDEQKLEVLGRRYDVPNLSTYDGVDDLFTSGEIDAVYIALPQ
jgi:predicted dehydrogenase